MTCNYGWVQFFPVEGLPLLALINCAFVYKSYIKFYCQSEVEEAAKILLQMCTVLVQFYIRPNTREIVEQLPTLKLQVECIFFVLCECVRARACVAFSIYRITHRLFVVRFFLLTHCFNAASPSAKLNSLEKAMEEEKKTTKYV